MNKWLIDDLHRKRKKLGFAFGSQFDLITEAWSNGIEALSLICPTEQIVKEASAYVLHPAVLDACFQSMLLLKEMEGKFIPRKIAHVTMLRKPSCTDHFYAYTKMVASEKTPTCNITLMDRYARPVMIFERFITEDISVDKTKASFKNAAFKFGWEQFPSKTPKTDRNNVWIILRNQSKLSKRFSQHVPAGERIYFVDVQDNCDATRAAISEALDQALGNMKEDEKLLMINFWPVDCNKFNAETCNFDATHSLAFESCLSVSQEILKRKAVAKNIQLVFVVSEVVTIPQNDHLPRIDTSSTFPWSASVLGFRRTFSEEIPGINVSVVDFSNDPCDDDLRAMVEDVRNETMEEELAYRDGIRYVNRYKEVDLERKAFTIEEPPITKDGVQKPFKMTSMSEQWFLQKTSNKLVIGKSKRMTINVEFASTILQKPWIDLKKNDRISFAGRLCVGSNEKHNSNVIGFCKMDDLGSYIDVEKCCFAQIDGTFSAQQAAPLSFLLAMSYHILTNLLSGVKGKKVLFFHENGEVCSVFACVAMSLNVKVVCLVKTGSSKERMNKVGNLVVITEDEIERWQLDGVDSLDLDVVCLLSRSNSYVIRQIMKHLKHGASVISAHGQENAKFNHFIQRKDINYIMPSLEKITEDSNFFSNLVGSCCSVLKSTKFLETILNIPQQVSSIYDVMNYGSRDRDSCLEKEKDTCLHTVSLKPKNIPDKVAFYNLPLDENGLKADRTYLVIGGVSGFGFEVAKWMTENGANTVMCTSRSAPSEKKKADVQQLERETGSRLLLRQADATSLADMKVIKEELEHLPAVAGIVFTAMVLQDQFLEDADFETCKKVVETKVKGNSLVTKNLQDVQLLAFEYLQTQNLFLTKYQCKQIIKISIFFGLDN